MYLKNINHNFAYQVQKIATMFFPTEKISNDEKSKIIIVTEKNNCSLTVTVNAFDKSIKKQCNAQNEDMALAMSLLLFNALTELTGFELPWGILYGVRPAKLMHSKFEQLGESGARDYFKKRLVSDKKLELAMTVMKNENRIIKLSEDNSCSLYVSIPFCPSRCAYCSFVSHSIDNAKDLIEPYVKLLCDELEKTAAIIKSLKLRLETIYFGGGTPTSLSSEQLDKILCSIEKYFDLSCLREYTVEAGRPDTITKAKLDTLFCHKVERISINPQSFNDYILKSIGRRHTAKQVVDSYILARETGFDNINMDLIAGLKDETLSSFQNSVDTAIKLGANSITIHNLALKSASFLVTENELFDVSRKTLVSDMIDYSYARLTEDGYNPYYMYRQSKSLGNLENCGYSKKDNECLYNVFMMDETHTVFGVGAGAVNMLKSQKTGHIERIYNYKYPYEYINSFDEILKRKSGIYNFYNEQ